MTFTCKTTADKPSKVLLLKAAMSAMSLQSRPVPLNIPVFLFLFCFVFMCPVETLYHRSSCKKKSFPKCIFTGEKRKKNKPTVAGTKVC